MKIDDRNLTGTAASQPRQSSPSREVDHSTGGGLPVSQSGRGGDEVALSGLVGKLAHALSVGAQEQANRVERLGEEYAAGRYRADALDVSRAILAETRMQGAPEQSGLPQV
jgi:hypothetical protein